MKNMQERGVIIVPYLEIDADYSEPEKLMIQFDPINKPKPVDIGCICFTRREMPKNGTHNGKKLRPMFVDPSTFKKERRALISVTLDRFLTSSWRQVSAYGCWKQLKCIIDWADLNGHQDIFISEEQTLEAYKEFTEYLYHQFHTAKRFQKPETISNMQRYFRTFTEWTHGSDFSKYLSSTTIHINSQRNTTPAPTELAVKTYTSTIFPLVENLSKALMNEPFPFCINCGSYDAILIPSFVHPAYTPYASEKNSLYDYEECRLKSYQEWIDGKNITGNNKADRRTYEKGLNILNESNQNMRSYYRSYWAQKVIKGYASLLQMITGANPTQLVRFEYEEALDIVNDSHNKELTGIKFRASGKKVRYPIGGKKGLRLLKDYLAFRSWYLDGTKFEYLFFSDFEPQSPRNRRGEPKPLVEHFQSRFFKQSKGVFLPGDSKNVTPTQARKYKSIILHELNIAPAVIADSLNHSVATNLAHYANPSREHLAKELNKFWKSVKAATSQIPILRSSSNSSSSVTGHCSDMGNPNPIETDAQIPPNCSTQYGCLYCKNYLFHADHEDIRKLYSLQYVLGEVRKFADDQNHADQLFQNLSLRTNSIIEDACKLYPDIQELSEKIKNEVFELGILTPFWESRLSRYEEMGVLL